MVQDSSRWCGVVGGDADWCMIVQNGAGLFWMVQNGAGWCKRLLNVGLVLDSA